MLYEDRTDNVLSRNPRYKEMRPDMPLSSHICLDLSSWYHTGQFQSHIIELIIPALVVHAVLNRRLFTARAWTWLWHALKLASLSNYVSCVDIICLRHCSPSTSILTSSHINHAIHILICLLEFLCSPIMGSIYSITMSMYMFAD